MSRSKVKGQGHPSHHPSAATEWNALAAHNVMRHQTEPFRRYRGGDFGGLRAVCLWKNIFSSSSNYFVDH